MPCSDNCIKMYLHSGLSVFPNQGLPKAEAKCFKWSDWQMTCTKFVRIVRISSLSPIPCQRQILLFTDYISGKNGVDISSPFPFLFFLAFKDIIFRSPHHQTAVLRGQEAVRKFKTIWACHPMLWAF